MRTKKELYGNWLVKSPDGIEMFYTDSRRVKWYLDRSLAVIEDEDVRIMRLTFTPNGLGQHRPNKSLTKYHNLCVVCGSSENLTRHHVIPYCYRRFFPENMKTHKCEDIVGLCVDCHNTYEKYALCKKRDLAESFGDPLHYIIPIEGAKEKLHISGFAKTLVKDIENKIPANRKKEMIQRIAQSLGREVTDDDLKQLSKEKINLNMGESHGQKIVSKISNLDDFIQSWRDHFVSCMSPKYLPKEWKENND